MSNITLRDHFAGLAMNAVVGDCNSVYRVAEVAYQLADAMIAERNKHKERHEELLCQGEPV